jgi:DNA-binding HxlR family transcriptional regulator
MSEDQVPRNGSSRRYAHPEHDAPPKPTKCPIGLALGVIGQTWTLLLVREAIKGVRRFDEFQSRLGVSRPLLSQRLSMLVEEGILERVPYREPNQRSRFEYRLTPKGYDLYPVMMALRQWGVRYLLDEEPATVVEHRDCGEPVSLRLVCEAGHELESCHEAITRPASAVATQT